MNKHIALVKKWLADPESVSEEERRANSDAASYAAAAAAAAAADAVDTATVDTSYTAATVSISAYDAADAADDAASAAVDGNVGAAKNAVEQYEQLTNRGE